MVYELENTELVSDLFCGWEETLIYSCMQKVMGKIYVVDMEKPKSTKAVVGCFVFLAGEPCEELILHKCDGACILTPQNEAWAAMIEQCYPNHFNRAVRYAIKKDTTFDRELLKGYVRELPSEYELKLIDGELYERCLEGGWTSDFVNVFDSKEHFLKSGLGMVVLRENEIVAGASSYTAYKEGIEIEVDTKMEERRKHLATAVCAALILVCLDRGLYPSWDAQNMWSVHLAQKLGYEFAHEYTVYIINYE